MHVTLRNVLMHPVVCDKDRSARCAVYCLRNRAIGQTLALRVKILHVVVDAWKKPSATLNPVLMSHAKSRRGSLELRAVGARLLQGVSQSEGQRRLIRIGLIGWDCAGGIRAGCFQLHILLRVEAADQHQTYT